MTKEGYKKKKINRKLVFRREFVLIMDKADNQEAI